MTHVWAHLHFKLWFVLTLWQWFWVVLDQWEVFSTPMTIFDFFSPSDRIEHIEHFCNIELCFKMMQHFTFSTSETTGSSISSLVLQDFILTHFGDMSCLNFFLCVNLKYSPNSASIKKIMHQNLKKMTKIVVASFCGKLALFCFHWAFSTTFRS